MVPRFTLAPMDCSTRFGPLVALGFFVRQHDLWAPFRDRVCFNTPTHCKEPLNALYDMWIGILAGCEVVCSVKWVQKSSLSERVAHSDSRVDPSQRLGKHGGPIHRPARANPGQGQGR